VIDRSVTRRRLREREFDGEFWLGRPAAERIAHVEASRAEYYGWTGGAGPRLQRVQIPLSAVRHAPDSADRHLTHLIVASDVG
jgi:hypothetical protein